MKKKKILLGMLTGAAALAALVSCGKKADDNKKDDTTSETTTSKDTTTSGASDTSTTTTAQGDVTTTAGDVTTTQGNVTTTAGDVTTTTEGGNTTTAGDVTTTTQGGNTTTSELDEDEFTTAPYSMGLITGTRYQSKKTGKVYYSTELSGETVYFGFDGSYNPTYTDCGLISLSAYSFEDNIFSQIDSFEIYTDDLTYGEYYSYDEENECYEYIDVDYFEDEDIQDFIKSYFTTNDEEIEAFTYCFYSCNPSFNLDGIDASKITYPVRVYDANDEFLYETRIARTDTFNDLIDEIELENQDYLDTLSSYSYEICPTYEEEPFDFDPTDDNELTLATYDIIVNIKAEAEIPADEYKVKFNMGSDSVNKVTTDKFLQIEQDALDTEVDPGDGYAFLGWSVDADAEEPEYVIDGVYYFSGNTELYPVWGDLCLLEYDASPTDAILEADYDRFNDFVLLDMPEDATYAGHTFAGWMFDDDDYVYLPGQVVRLYEDKTIYAVWYTDTVVSEVTLEKDGLIRHTLEEDPDLNYEEKISKNTLFKMYVEDGFRITTGDYPGTVLTGKVLSGVLRTGDQIDMYDVKNQTLRTVTVQGIEMFRKIIDQAEAGDNIGISISFDELDYGTNTSSYTRGALLCTKGKMITSNTFMMELDFTRDTDATVNSDPNESTYRPQFYIGATDITGEIRRALDYTTLNEVSTLTNGGKYLIYVKLIHTTTPLIGDTIAVREGGKTVGTGRVIARTSEQMSNILNNTVRITVDKNTLSNETEVLYVQKGTLIGDIECPFERPGYEFVGWMYASNKTENQTYDPDEFAIMMEESVNSWNNQTIYAVWEKINDVSNYGFYITQTRHVSEKHTYYSNLITDSIVYRNYKVGDTIKIHLQDGTTLSKTIDKIYSISDATYTEIEETTLGVSFNICIQISYTPEIEACDYIE